MNSTLTSAEITATSGSNLALSFFSLSPEKKKAMSIFYAFCRVVDDIADSTTLSVSEKTTQLAEWHEEIQRLYSGKPRFPLGHELATVTRQFPIPENLFHEILWGMEMDIDHDRYPDFVSLKQYCYRVASAVGLVSIEIFGYHNPQTRDYAIALGMAFQLTNILRDVKKDASIGRIYLPLDELAHWKISEADILQSRWSPEMCHFLRFQYHRARHYFAKSWRLLSAVDRPNLLASEMMRGVYSGVLDKIRDRNFNVFQNETKLSKTEKMWKILQTYRREKRAMPTPPPPKKVLILGAGFAGLAAAFELTLHGHEVTVLESKSFLGGRAQSFVETKTGKTIDNGQHVLMGCYHETLQLIQNLGVDHRLLTPESLDIPYRSNHGKSFLRAPQLAAPLHLLIALFKFEELNGRDRWAAIQLSFRLQLGQKPLFEETVKTWLTRWHQTSNLIRAVWEPLCIAALNEPLETASAMLFALVIQRTLLGSAEDSKIILSRVGLSELFAPEIETLLKMCGGKIERNQVVSEMRFDENQILEVKTQTGQSYQADYIISALPWNVLRAFLPPESVLAEKCRELKEAPIVSLHLWLDRPIISEPFIGFLDSPLHWIFNRDLIESNQKNPSHHYSLVISGATSLIDNSSADLEKMAVAEMHRLLPESRNAQIKHRFIYKSRAATFAATPEAEKFRPYPKTLWKNFWLAGDWTQTGLPATIEGAILSGRRTAELVDHAPMI